MSLLGKPINYKNSKRDMKYRKIQARIYNFLERPRGAKAICYHMLVFLTIFLCLTLSVLSTIEDEYDEYDEALFVIEIFVVIWFSVEFFLRVWSSGCRSRYQGALGRFKYSKRPFCVIDVVTIVASIVVLIHGSMRESMSSGNQVVSAVRSLRFFQILRMVRMDRRGGTWKLLGSVVYAHRQELITTLYIGFLGLIFASFLVFLVEKEDDPEVGSNPQFQNFPDALWWGVITLCTVGYGDVVPKTWGGKIIASGCALLGITFFALPAGILGSGFALKVQQQQRQKHMIRRRQPAASLIQCLWRCYAADENSMSIATWKIHQVPMPSPPSFKHNASFVRLPTIRRHRNNAQSPSIKGRHVDSNHALDTLASKLNAASQFDDSLTKDGSELYLAKKNSDVNLKLYKPLLRSKPRSAAGSPGEPDVDVSLLQHNEEPQFSPLQLVNLLHTEMAKGSQSPRTTRGRSLSNIFCRHSPPPDEDEEQARVHQLTYQHKWAIRSLRKIKYFVARRKFKEALKPYDVKDVIEQYSSGNADLLQRVKLVHGRLDQILGKQGSKAKDVYASNISLASRIVKVERQVDDIEGKIDQLIELYMEDRKRRFALPPPSASRGGEFASSDQHSDILHEKRFLASQDALSYAQNIYSHQITSPLSSSTCLTVPSTAISRPSSVVSSLRPKPILVDKQASEPNTPTARNFEKPMTRGNSDISYKIKKRVTLGSLPSRHSLETRENDLLQIPQIVHLNCTSPIEEDSSDSLPSQDKTSTMSTDCDSFNPCLGTKTILEENPTIKEEQASCCNSEESELHHSSHPKVIPTISGSVAEAPNSTSTSILPKSPSFRLYCEYNPPHHPHLLHHQPAFQRRASCNSLANLDQPSSPLDTFELKSSNQNIPNNNNSKKMVSKDHLS